MLIHSVSISSVISITRISGKGHANSSTWRERQVRARQHKRQFIVVGFECDCKTESEDDCNDDNDNDDRNGNVAEDHFDNKAKNNK